MQINELNAITTIYSLRNPAQSTIGILLTFKNIIQPKKEKSG